MLTLIIFIVILAVLVFVHELGHFIVAKISGIRVDEFGLGFPPRIVGWKPKNSETTYTLNWIPFGGFVKIFGENPDEESTDGADSKRSIVNKPKLVQVAVLIAGIAFNIIFAWILISSGYVTGLPSSVSDTLSIKYPSQLSDIRLTVTDVTPKSPAEAAGIQVGDALLSVQSGKDSLQGTDLTPQNLQQFTASHGDERMTIDDQRGKTDMTITVTPIQGIVAGKPAIGIGMDMIGRLQLPFFQAFYEGAKLTGDLIESTAVGLGQFLWQAVTGHANFSQVTGPVGIEGMVGQVQQLGFIYLLSFTALISINLAVLNLLPFPALDGGRILFVIIEAIKRSRINPKIANTVNAVGFVLLILLMLVITYKDVVTRFF